MDCDPLDPYCDDPLPPASVTRSPMFTNSLVGGDMIGDTQSIFNVFGQDASYSTPGINPAASTDPNYVALPATTIHGNAGGIDTKSLVMYGALALAGIWLLSKAR